MSTTAGFSEQGHEVYQSVSRAAIASVVLAAFGLAAIWFVPMLLIPVLGVVAAVLALRDFARFPDEIIGRPVAWIGGGASLLLLVVAPAIHTYVYLTEVPDGYTRVDFNALLSAKGQPDEPTSFAINIDGEDVFIKGYIHPTSMSTLKAKRFVLVPDLGTCCFGGQPPLTHMIEVNLTGEQYAQKSYRRQRLAGKFNVNPALKPVDGLTGVYYQLRADILK